MAKKKKAIYDKEAEGEILISSFLPQSPGQPGPGGAACGRRAALEYRVWRVETEETGTRALNGHLV